MGIKLETFGDKFKLLEDYEVRGYTIPKGFPTDFATLPRWTLSLLGRPTRGQYQRASLLHDYLLKAHILERWEADMIFHELLLEDGSSEFKAKVMYLSVSFFGKYIRPFINK
jgi:hypothetical protein